MRRKLLYLLVIGCCSAAPAWSQQPPLSNLREKVLVTGQDRQQLDSLSIVPSSVIVRQVDDGRLLDTSFYRIDHRDIIWKKQPAESVTVTYRVLPYDLGKPLARLDTAGIESDDQGLILGFDYNPYAEEQDLLDFKGLDYNGSFSRGISFGNNQDLVLNSSFNLQMAGNLGDGVEILAAITDENIPLQAEGNTQQLREFDKVFIQLRKGSSSLTAGDYELRRPDSYFMNYFKKLQGATFSTEKIIDENERIRGNASVAVSRGQFARNTIPQQEGNQGPYKLRGSEGERFIIVLSGTEKVWLDGELLERGLERDYIIDYNRGELTFTHRRLITKDSRIIVEFEYSDQSYLRSLFAMNTEYEKDKLRLHFNLYNQQDSKNSTGDERLSDEAKRVLRDAGDDLSTAIVSTIDTLDGANSLRATYELVDTTLRCNGREAISKVLRYSADPEKGTFVARFSEVGQGNGNYILDPENIANERVYRWVAPDTVTCQARGNYEPVAQLAAPRQQQLFTAGAEYRFSPSSGIRTELALSRYDLNRFSRLDKDNDVGMASYTAYNKDFRLGSDSSGWLLSTEVGYEYVQHNFQAINPYRDPEFLRDWNLADQQGIGQVKQAEEHIGRTVFSLHKAGWGSLSYGFSAFFRDSLYTGTRHFSALRLNRNGWNLDAGGSLLDSDEADRRTRFFRPAINLSKTFKELKNWRIGVHGEREKSDRYDAKSDSLAATSFYYDRYRIFLESDEAQALKFGANFTKRFDYAPFGERYALTTMADEFNLNGGWEVRSEQNRAQLTGNFTYRQLEIEAQELTAQDPAETFLGRLDLNTSFLKGVIRSNTTYEIGSGQEPKVEYTYAQVTPGSGTHIWLDSLYNNDGKIQENEMEVAPFQDIADFVRISIITDDFIRTNNVGLNQSLELTPRVLWYGSEGFKKFISRLSTRSSLRITRKTREAESVNSWDPFQLELPDSALVSLSSSIRNTLLFNQSDPKYGFQLSQSDTRSRIVQTTGYEARGLAEYSLEGRWNISSIFSATVNFVLGDRESDSEFFDNRDYRLHFREWTPELTYLPVKTFRTKVNYSYRRDENVLVPEGENATQQSLGIEATFNQSARSAYRLNFSYVDARFNGEPNSPVGLAILNGLRNGRNFLWNLNLDRQLTKNIRLSVSYEGRKTGDARVVHVGRAQVAATF